MPFYFSDGVQAEGKSETAAPEQSARQSSGEIADPELIRAFSPATMNLTKIGEVYRKDPALAARIARRWVTACSITSDGVPTSKKKTPDQR